MEPFNTTYKKWEPIEDMSQLNFINKLEKRARVSCHRLGLGFEASNLCIEGYPIFMINWHGPESGVGVLHLTDFEELVKYLEENDPIQQQQKELFA